MLTHSGAVVLLLSPMFVVSHFPAGCMIWMWFVSIGFSLFIVPLVLKIYRLDRILDVKTWEVFAITDTQLMIGVSAFVGFQILLLTTWSILDPIVLTIVSNEDIQNSQAEICKTGSVTGTVFYIIELFYAAFLLLVACVISVRIRNQHIGVVNESREIIIAVYNFAIGIIVISVLGVILVSDESSWALLVSLGTTAVTLLSWAAMYVLKLWRIYTKQEKMFKKGKIASINAQSTSTSKSNEP